MQRWISLLLEEKLNVYNDDFTNTEGIYFDYKMPLDLFDSYEKLPQLIVYLEENLGLSIVKTKKLETIYKKKIEDLEELKKSVLQKAFSGELETAKSQRDNLMVEK